MRGLGRSPEISPDPQLSSSHPTGGDFQRERGAHYVWMVYGSASDLQLRSLRLRGPVLRPGPLSLQMARQPSPIPELESGVVSLRAKG